MTKTGTINSKTTKTGLIDFIRNSLSTVSDENLLSRIIYTVKSLDKNANDVPKSDLYDLAKEISAVLTPTPQVVAENSPKPKLGKKKTTTTDTIEDVDNQAEAETTEKSPKKTMKKSVKKTAPAVETTEGLTAKALPIAKVFPKEIDHESLGKLVACPDKYHTIQEVREAIEADKTLIFACYWTKRHIKECAYSLVHEVPVPKDGFPYDLDTLQALYVCEGIDRIYALSTYTEAAFRFNAEDLEHTECTANDGSKFMMRYSAGLEFEIYEVVDEA